MRNAYQIILRQYYPPGENSISLVGYIAGDSLEEVSDRVIANLENANKNIEEVNYGETKKEQPSRDESPSPSAEATEAGRGNKGVRNGAKKRTASKPKSNRRRRNKK